MHGYIAQLHQAAQKLALMESQLDISGVRLTEHDARHEKKPIPRATYESSATRGPYRIHGALLLEGDDARPDHTANVTLTRIADNRSVSVIYDTATQRYAVNIDGDWRDCAGIAKHLATADISPFTTNGYAYLGNESTATMIVFHLGYAFVNAEEKAA